MDELSKRDQALEVLCMVLATFPSNRGELVTLVNLIIDAAKEEILAELAEQAEERRWHVLNAAAHGPDDGPLGVRFWEEWQALRAKREAAGKPME